MHSCAQGSPQGSPQDGGIRARAQGFPQDGGSGGLPFPNSMPSFQNFDFFCLLDIYAILLQFAVDLFQISSFPHKNDISAFDVENLGKTLVCHNCILVLSSPRLIVFGRGQL